MLLARTKDGAERITLSAEQEGLREARRNLQNGQRDFFQVIKERGLTLAPEQLVFIGHWITPAGLPKRFDTRFFLAEVDSQVEVLPDEDEIFEGRWLKPAEAMRPVRCRPLVPSK